MLRKFIIEREVPKVGSFDHTQMMGVAKTSNAALEQLGPKIQWVESYVTDNKTFCVYLAENEELLREHSRLSGFPANIVTEVRTMIDPQTERA
ncbi:MAG TPA: DUF4242 domain-containing protein [Devosia sp.]|jgi:hypothetical protein|nr:DUF4242 domain-containing protein [Devosia sp.]